MEVKIPFNAWSKARLREGRKTSTARTKVYGKTNDTFTVEGRHYIIKSFGLCATEVIIEKHWDKEGAKSPEELRQVLRGIFRGKEIPHFLYLHVFEEKKR